MRHNDIGSPAPPFFDNVKTRNFLGDNAAHARVTVEPAWSIKKTASIYGNSFRGPYRYYTDGNPEEYEVPSIQSVTWNRSNSQDLATATITIYNSWHNTNTETPEQTTHLGKKGYFWPKRGQGDSATTWSQESAKGAYDKDGVWHPTFSWENVLVEDALLRTYEGYGNKPTSGNYISIQDNLDNENLLITGVWIINTVSAGSDGKMTLQCTDIGRILLDQMVFPPIIPEAVYPLEYYPPGQSAFASPWGPKIKNKLPKVSNVTHNEFGQEVTTSPASKGEIFIRDASGTGDSDSTVNTAHPSSHAVDGDWNTYALSEAYATMDAGKPYWEFLPGHNASYGAGIDGLSLKTWAGGYTVYVSVLEDNFPSSPTGTSTWKGTESIPGGGIKYIKKIDVPLALPDGMEKYILIDFDNILPNDEIRSVEDGYGTTNNPAQPNTYYAQKVRLTFENLYYSHIPDGSDRYRAGIRDFVLYRNGLKLSGWTPEFEVLPWSFTMTQHPTRGYWVADSRGNVYGFGDAADYDTTGFGQIDLEGDENNRVVGMAAHPSGEGYWVLDWMGNVYAQGAASHHGDFPVPNPYVRLGQQGKVQARGIAATYTGNGYWVLYSNGGVAGFGDATPNSNFVPNTDVAIFMDSFLSSTYDTGTYIPYQIGLKGTAIASHPKKIEYIVTDGSGQVFKSVDGGPLIWQKSQGLYNRVYGSKKTAGTFKLQNLEWATDIEYTVDGDGWWIAFGSGRVASFGNATKLGKNPYVFESLGKVYEDNIIVDDVKTFIDALGFRDILWSLARDPDGTGFWVLKADGSVIAYEAEFWGKPGYEGLTGYRWHDGNFNGDWANIVKEILTWAGFLFYEPDIADDEAPSVFGLIESTGIVTDTQVPPDKFDKKTLIDVIKELTEVVGYLFRITEDGRAQYASPNWWRAGNFDQNGYPIYVSSVTGERVASDDVDAIPFIPVIHEDEDMLNYNVTLSSADKRSVIYVGTDLPDAKDPTKTSYIRHVPPSSLETVSGGVNTMRGIERPAIWVSQLFENEQERKLMAELIGLHAWFGSRVGSTSIIGNPALSVDDQVRLVEQNTSETFIHLITGLNSSLDNDTGVYTMDLNTYWLGDADDWVIATEPKEASEYVYTVISNELNSWQTKTGRGLTGGGSSDTGIFTVTGEFNRTIFEVNSINEMIVLGDSLSYLDSTLNGLTGDRWPNLLENSGSVVTVKNGAFSGWTSQNLVDTPIVAPESTDALVIFVGANDQNTSLSGVTIEEYSQNLLYLLDHYPATKQLVVFPWPWTGYPPVADPAPTEVEYYGYRDAAQAAASIRGASFLDMGDVISTIVAAAGETGWGDYIVDWIHASALGHQTLAEYISSKLYVSYGDDSNWQFSGTINTIDVINSIYMRVVSLSNLGSNIFMEIYDGSDLINYVELEYAGQLISLGSLGVDGESKQYTYVINGTPVSRGGGKIKLSFSADNSSAPSVEDTLILFDSNIPAPGSEEEVVDIPTEPTTPVTTSGVMFGYSANSHSDLQANIAAGMGTPQVWRHFLSSTIDSTTAWDSGIPVHISFKPDISQPVATWSGDLENLLRREGNASGQITYVTIWHEPENDLDKPFMASAANFRRALNEVTRVCRKLTGEDAGGTFYSAPTLMDWTLNPSSGRDINDWIDLDLVDYDIIVWDPYPNDHGVIPAIDIDVAMSATNHADNIRDIMDYSVSVGKPWAIGEIGTRRYDSEMSSAGVTSYTSTQRAVYMTDLANFVTGLSTPPVYVCYFTFGDNNVLENPEKAAINAIVSA